MSSGRIADLVMKIQNEFLDTPGLRLTRSQAAKRFVADTITCEAVLEALVDARVLVRTPDGDYVRFFPRIPVRAREAHVGPETAATHSRSTSNCAA